MDATTATSYKGRVKVLVVEDEKKIASFVRNGLEERGVVVDVCHRGDEGNELATTRCYDGIPDAGYSVPCVASAGAMAPPGSRRPLPCSTVGGVREPHR